MVTRRRLLIAASLLVVATLLLLAPLLVIRIDTGGHLSDSPESVTGHHQVAIVLGAGLTNDGRVSLFLRDRLDAAIQLYRMGKVDGLLLTGDNHVSTYNEPRAMQAYALSNGVPAGALTVDYAGFDTYDSCYRARHIFGVRSAEVVTQRYHVPRAVYLCRSVGIAADGLGLPDWGRVPVASMVHYQVREVLADAKALWEVDVTNPSPRYLGAHETLHLQPVT